LPPCLAAHRPHSTRQLKPFRLQVLRIDQDMRNEVVKELRENQSRTAEYVERRIAAEDQLKRIELRAPQSGTVHQLAVHTVGGVINGGEPVLFIVPDSDKLVVEAKIAPHDIDQVRRPEEVETGS
jgi:HlyD family secretion protein